MFPTFQYISNHILTFWIKMSSLCTITLHKLRRVPNGFALMTPIWALFRNFTTTCCTVFDFVQFSTLKYYIQLDTLYRIRAYNTPLLIKPPLQPNLNKPPLFCLKSPLFKAFWGKNPKNFNKLPPKSPQILINCWHTIGADTVILMYHCLAFKHLKIF